MEGSLAGIGFIQEDQVAMQQETLGRKRFCVAGGEKNGIFLAEETISHPPGASRTPFC